MPNSPIGIIGVGNIGNAIVSGLLKDTVQPASQLLVYDVDQSRLAALNKQDKVIICSSVEEVARQVSAIVVAVKPGQVREVLWSLAEMSLESKPIIISVAAGVSTRQILGVLGESWPVVRAMPNLPATVGQGVSAYFATHPDYVGVAEKVLGALGLVVKVAHEHDLDAVTGLSGSGPAFVFQIIEALADGGVKAGLGRSVAQKLAAQTVLGAAALLLQSGRHPAELKDLVASPGGTTIAGLHVLESGGLRGLLISAVEAATMRARELQVE